MRVGVYLCQADHPSAVNLEAVAKYAANLAGVEVAEYLGVRPKLTPADLSARIRRHRLDRVVIAGDSPGYFKPSFTTAMVLAGGNPDEVRLASFRGHGAVNADFTDRAKGIVACAVLGVPYTLAAIPSDTRVHPATLVIGGGVAGIQAALEVADAGIQVYLVERTPTIGGHMAMFDKTFPTLDCAACILTPKMVAVAQHDHIDLMTNAEVKEIAGSPGAYKVKVLRRARRVDVKACVACNACSDVCPVSVPSEFDSGIATRKSIYIPFPQAVPTAYLVDPDSCTYVLGDGKKCGACIRKCPKDCIVLDEKDETVELEVGNIVLATGYDVLDPRVIERTATAGFRMC
jgi:heterodisulfide reductase subunit A